MCALAIPELYTHVHAGTHTHRVDTPLDAALFVRVCVCVFRKQSSAEETVPSWQLQRTRVQSNITHWGWAGLVGSWPSKGREKPQSDGKELQTVTQAQNRLRIVPLAA